MQPVSAIGGQRVARLPRLQHQRQLQHLRMRTPIAAQVLAAQHPLLGDRAGDRRAAKVRRQLRPGVPGRGDLGQRPQRERAAPGSSTAA